MLELGLRCPSHGRYLVQRCSPYVVALAMAMWFVCVGAAQPSPSGRQERPDFAAIDRYVQQQMKDCRIPGFSLGIVGDGNVLYLKGYGRADESGRSVTPQTPFILASVSKTLTALAVMQLKEAGKLDLDATVSRYLPDLCDASGTCGRITVRHLLNHTAGLAPQLEYRATTPRDRRGGTLELARSILGFSLVSDPGTRFLYGNAAYIILGEIVSRASGLPYAEYVARNIFDPLAMHHSRASPDQTAEPRPAAGYRMLFGFPKVSGLAYAQGYVPAFGILSCAEDMTHYLIAVMNRGVYHDKRILSEDGVAEMLTPSSSVSRYVDYGLGWYVTSGSFYHGGELSDCLAKVKVLPHDGLGVVFLANASSSTAETLFGVGYRERIETGIINILYGVSPTDQPTRGPLHLGSYRMGLTYGLTPVLPVVTLLLLVLSALRLRSMPERLRGSRIAPARAAVSLAVFHVLAPLCVLWGVGRQGVSWAYVLHYLPDVGWLALAFSVLLLAIGAGKGIVLARFFGVGGRRWTG